MRVGNDPSLSSIREECHNERKFLMLFPFRFAGIITVIFAVCGPARAQELAPPGSDVSIHKMVIDSGFSHTVKYFVKGGSPPPLAPVPPAGWGEKEVKVVEKLTHLEPGNLGH